VIVKLLNSAATLWLPSPTVHRMMVAMIVPNSDKGYDFNFSFSFLSSQYHRMINLWEERWYTLSRGQAIKNNLSVSLIIKKRAYAVLQIL
jgi:hypothetical protein